VATVEDVKQTGKLGAEARSLRERLGGEVETVGVSPVPQSQRTMTPGVGRIVDLLGAVHRREPGLVRAQYGDRRLDPGVDHPTYLWDVVVGAAEIVLVLFGMKWLERFYRYTSLVLIASYLALTIYLVTHFTLHAPKQTVPMNWERHSRSC
jgi:hypothetical protein